MEEFKVPTLPLLGSKVEKNSQKEESSSDVAKTSTTEQSTTASSIEKQTPAIPTTLCPYKIPSWSATPSDQNLNYKFEVLKSGQIIEEIDHLQIQATWIFGRLPENDIVMAHPTISRYHAVLQYRPHHEISKEATAEGESNPPEGWYIYDLGSTHGTFLNKQRIPSKVFIRIRVGHMLRLGASSRSYILQGPVEDEEPESEFSITELREQRLRQQLEAADAKRKTELAEEERKKTEGVSWGMSEDANEETDLSYNPYASSNNEEYFATNPKQALRHFFEREDMPLEYKCDEMSVGSFVCRIELPVDDENGRSITAEVVHKGKKKDCVFQCALEACRILDRLGVLRQKNQEPLARRKKPQSDSDEDEFLDRTGDMARRKERKSNANASITLTYDDLLKQEQELLAEIEKNETDINEYQAKQKRLKEQAEAQNDGDLDSFMEHLNEDASKLDKTEIKKLRLEQQRLRTEQQKLKRLIKVAKPYGIHIGNKTTTEQERLKEDSSNAAKNKLPIIGKRNQFSKFKVFKPAAKAASTSKAYASDEEELEEDDMKEETINLENSKELKLKDELESVEKTVEQQIEKSTDDTQPNFIPEQKTLTETKLAKCEANTVAENAAPAAMNIEPKSPIEATSSSDADASRKRPRQRQRPRGKRQEVDVEDLNEHESSEKYAKWVPPANQSGDGFTALNEKYGY